MRKFYIITILLAIMVLSACSNTQDSIALQSKVSEKDKIISDLQKELETAQNERDKALADYSDIKSQLDKTKKESEVQQGDVTVNVTDKINIPKNINNSIYSNNVNFHFSIKNNTDKDIKGIQGVLDIQDLFGVSILKMNCDLVGNTIKPNETVVNEDLGFDINQFMNDHVKVYTTDYSDLKFSYTINKIVFADGTIKDSVTGIP